eukprot:scaffold43242_cov15-Tisochrysis_lutea.AAC.1
MDGEIKKEQIGTLPIRTGALEGGFWDFTKKLTLRPKQRGRRPLHSSGSARDCGSELFPRVFWGINENNTPKAPEGLQKPGTGGLKRAPCGEAAASGDRG